MNKTITIGYVCDSNPFEDRTAWSGLNYKIRESIENAGFKVVWINSCPNGKVSKLCKFWNEWWHGETTMFEHTRFFFRLRAHTINIKTIEECDVLFFPRRAQVINYLDCKKPVIYYSDATFSLMCGYYWNSLTKWQFNTGNALEAGAIKKSRINIRASHWAAKSVVEDYGFDSCHTYVLCFGANLEDSDIHPIIPYDGKGRLNILFSGVDWNRKGAEIAVLTVEKLKLKGIDVRLFIVGVNNIPEPYKKHPLVENVGFLNKSIQSEYKKYIEIVRSCHIFLLPTKAECAGIVFGECSAFGIPIYTYDTGGIGDYVINGKNGFRLPTTAGPEDFAKTILESLSPEKQRMVHNNCLEIYKDNLNWKVWGTKFRTIVNNEFSF